MMAANTDPTSDVEKNANRSAFRAATRRSFSAIASPSDSGSCTARNATTYAAVLATASQKVMSRTR
jgi:hypothetical protein